MADGLSTSTSLSRGTGLWSGHTSLYAGIGLYRGQTGGAAAPVNTVAPVVSGTTEQGGLLSCTTGTWTSSGALTYTYQWLRDGVSIGSATANTYTVTALDEGAQISCRVRAEDIAGATNATSNTVTIATRPIVANQTAYFGNLTKSADGGHWTPVNTGGTITSASIDSGDPSNYFDITTDGRIYVNATGDGANLPGGPFTLGCTFTNAVASDTATITVEVVNNAYSVTSVTGAGNAITDIGTPASMSSARQIMFRAGLTYSGSTMAISNKAFAYTVELTTHPNEDMPWLEGGLVSSSAYAVYISNSNNVFINGLKLSTSVNSGAIFYAQGTCTNLRIHECEIFSTIGLQESDGNQASPVPVAIQFNGSATLSNLEVVNNYIHDANYCCDDFASTGDSRFDGNLCIDFMQDCVQIGQRNGATSMSISDNVMIGAIGQPRPYPGYPYDYHPDFVQFSSIGTTEDWIGITIYRNIMLDIYQSSGSQGLFLAGATSPYYMTGIEVKHNVLTTKGITSNGFSLARAKNAVVEYNTIVPATFSSGIHPGVTATIYVGQVANGGGNIVRNNIACGPVTAPGATTSNNINLGTSAATIPLADLFDGPDFEIYTRDDALTKLSLTPGNVAGVTGAGAVGAGTVTWATTSPGDDGSFSGGVPTNTVAPLITGTLNVGDTLSVTDGTWIGSPTSYAYQWYDNAVAIAGATNNTFLLTVSESGGSITCGVVATNAYGDSTEAISNAVGPITGGGATDTSMTYGADSFESYYGGRTFG